MTRTRLTPPQVRAIARAWTGTPKNEERLARLYGLKPRALRPIARRGGNPKAAKKRFRWTPAQERVLRERFPGTPTRELAAELGRDYLAIWRKARVLGLRKDPAVVAAERARTNALLAEAGRAHRIRPGAVPPNKGLRRPGYAPGRMAETQFRKGKRNHNYMPIGTERDIEGVLYVKVADVMNAPYTVNWVAAHDLVWMREHGPVPAGHFVKFIDGDKRNFELSNLRLCSLAENMARNTIHRYPPDVRDVIRLQARLERAIGERMAA